MDNLTFDWRVGFGMKSVWGGNYGGESISQIACVGDMSDEIIGTAVICQHTPRAVDICRFFKAGFLRVWLSQTQLSWEPSFLGYFQCPSRKGC